MSHSQVLRKTSIPNWFRITGPIKTNNVHNSLLVVAFQFGAHDPQVVHIFATH
jgi:hypothetical protein